MSLEEILGDEFDGLRDEYVAQVGQFIGEMRAALEGDDFPEIRRLGHSLKGSGAMFGFHDVGDIGARIEQAAMQRDRPAIPAMIEELDKAYRKLPKAA